MRAYYLSKEIIECLISDNDSIECCVRTKERSNIQVLTSVVEKTDSERGRHDLSILYKTATINGHTFQLGLDFVDYGAGGLEYGEGKKTTQAGRRKLLNSDSVLIYELSEEKDKSTVFFKAEVLADDVGVLSEIDTVTSKVDIEAVISGLKDGSVVILPVNKENWKYADILWDKNSETLFRFHKEYMPKCYTDIACILNDKVTVPKDFVLYDFLVMQRKVEEDAKGNKWVTLCYGCCLNTLDLLELDNTGKAHMYILDNFKDIDKQEIYKSFLNLNKSYVSFNTILRVIEKAQPTSTKWVEEHIIDDVKNKQNYYFSDYIDIIVKYTRAAKKSKDKDIERFLDMMLHYSGYVHMDGYVRILKALKLKEAELAKYIQRIISEDKLANNAGGYAASFIANWKTESFKELEDYVYGGIKTQDICEPFKDYNWKTDEEKQKRGLNTGYDFVTNYLKLLSIKGTDKLSLIERYIKGMEEDINHFPASVLLSTLDHELRYNGFNQSIPLFVHCIINYDRYGEYAKAYLSKSRQKELGFYNSFCSCSYYTPEFEEYADALSKVAIDGKKNKSDDELAKRKKG